MPRLGQWHQIAARAAGEAGGSALAKAEAIEDAPGNGGRKRWGDLAAVVAARMSSKCGVARRWAKGGDAEGRLAAWVEHEVGDAAIALHDRVIPGVTANIDYLFVARNGVWVVDTKAYDGKVERRDVGPLGRADVRLYVNRRDRRSSLTVPNQLGVEYNAHVIQSLLNCVAPELGWR